jgi:hypothetical protein
MPSMKRNAREASESPGAPETDQGPSPPTPNTPQWNLYSRLRYWSLSNRFFLSLLVLVAGGILTTIAIAAWTPLISSPLFSGFVPGLKGTDGPSGTGPDWTLAMAIVGPILVIVGGYLAGSYIIARERFEHLMKTRSKAEFLRNVPEVEDLIWDLTPRDHERLIRKKQEFKIRG